MESRTVAMSFYCIRCHPHPSASIPSASHVFFPNLRWRQGPPRVEPFPAVAAPVRLQSEYTKNNVPQLRMGTSQTILLKTPRTYKGLSAHTAPSPSLPHGRAADGEESRTGAF